MPEELPPIQTRELPFAEASRPRRDGIGTDATSPPYASAPVRLRDGAALEVAAALTAPARRSRGVHD